MSGTAARARFSRLHTEKPLMSGSSAASRMRSGGCLAAALDGRLAGLQRGHREAGGAEGAADLVRERGVRLDEEDVKAHVDPACYPRSRRRTKSGRADISAPPARARRARGDAADRPARGRLDCSRAHLLRHPRGRARPRRGRRLGPLRPRRRRRRGARRRGRRHARHAPALGRERAPRRLVPGARRGRRGAPASTGACVAEVPDEDWGEGWKKGLRAARRGPGAGASVLDRRGAPARRRSRW